MVSILVFLSHKLHSLVVYIDSCIIPSRHRMPALCPPLRRGRKGKGRRVWRRHSTKRVGPNRGRWGLAVALLIVMIVLVTDDQTKNFVNRQQDIAARRWWFLLIIFHFVSFGFSPLLSQVSSLCTTFDSYKCWKGTVSNSIFDLMNPNVS